MNKLITTQAVRNSFLARTIYIQHKTNAIQPKHCLEKNQRVQISFHGYIKLKFDVPFVLVSAFTVSLGKSS